MLFFHPNDLLANTLVVLRGGLGSGSAPRIGMPSQAGEACAALRRYVATVGSQVLRWDDRNGRLDGLVSLAFRQL